MFSRPFLRISKCRLHSLCRDRCAGNGKHDRRVYQRLSGASYRSAKDISNRYGAGGMTVTPVVPLCKRVSPFRS